eukprot:747091-Hanusia_phi.AAC.5
MDSSQTTFYKNTFECSHQGALWLQGSSKCNILDNVMKGNGKTHIQVSHRADPNVTGNSLLNGKGGGVVVHDEGKGLFERNIIKGNEQAGIGLIDRSKSVFIQNQIEGNGGGGAAIDGQSAPIFESNVFRQNLAHGICISGVSQPFMIYNHVSNHDGSGILVQDAAVPLLQQNKIESNTQGGIIATGTSKPSIHQCTIYSGEHTSQPLGLLCRDNARIEMEENNIWGHPSCNVIFRDSSIGKMSSNEVSNGQCGGVIVQGEACVSLVHNTIKANGICNVGVLESGCINCHHNSILESSGCGILLLGDGDCECKFNMVTGNKSIGIRCSGTSHPVLTHNRISNTSNGCGVLVGGRSKAALRYNLIFDNAESGLAVRDKSKPEIYMNIVVPKLNSHPGTLYLSGSSNAKVNGNTFIITTPADLRITQKNKSLLTANSILEYQEFPDIVDEARKILEVMQVKHVVVRGPDPDEPFVLGRTNPQNTAAEEKDVSAKSRTSARKHVSRTEEDVPCRRVTDSNASLSRTGESSNVSADIASGLFVVRYCFLMLAPTSFDSSQEFEPSLDPTSWGAKQRLRRASNGPRANGRLQRKTNTKCLLPSVALPT